MSVEESRRAILEEIGDPPDLTLVRVYGNRGDELIRAGALALLAERIYGEVHLTHLPAARGHTVLLPGSGAFCRPFHDLLPRVLAVAELRFERVIVLPSSFDPSEDEVRESLRRSNATVFARESESFTRIASLCDARLAHDLAFFFDYAPWRRPGSGTLNAFRTDREASGEVPVPPDNDDISVSAGSLDQWLARIAERELVRTDRAHVMIAAALLGKQVRYAPSSYHKLDALAEFALGELDVRRIEPRAGGEARPAKSSGSGRIAPKPARAAVTAVLVTRDRTRLALRAIDSLAAGGVPVQTVVLDNNSAPGEAAALAAGCAERERVRLHRSDRNLAAGVAELVGVPSLDSEFVLLLDDDVELEQGALARLLAELRAASGAAAVSATVVMDDGAVHHSGGALRVSREVAEFELIGAGGPVEALPPSGPADWVPGTAVLIRRSLLEDFPAPGLLRRYFEDNEWCYRISLARPGSFRRSREALAIHHYTPKNGAGEDFPTRWQAARLLLECARFYERHGRLLAPGVFDLVPELTDPNGARDIAAARLLMELLLARGPEWVFTQWSAGELEVLLGGRRRAAATIAAREQTIAEQRRALDRQHEQLLFYLMRHELLERIESGGWWRLRGRLMPVLRLWWRMRSTGAGDCA